MPSLFQIHNILDGFRGSQHIHTTPSFPTTMDFIEFLTADGHRGYWISIALNFLFLVFQILSIEST